MWFFFFKYLGVHLYVCCVNKMSVQCDIGLWFCTKLLENLPVFPGGGCLAFSYFLQWSVSFGGGLCHAVSKVKMREVATLLLWCFDVHDSCMWCTYMIMPFEVGALFLIITNGTKPYAPNQYLCWHRCSTLKTKGIYKCKIQVSYKCMKSKGLLKAFFSLLTCLLCKSASTWVVDNSVHREHFGFFVCFLLGKNILVASKTKLWHFHG